jgi:hypothetical protein
MTEETEASEQYRLFMVVTEYAEVGVEQVFAGE